MCRQPLDWDRLLSFIPRTSTDKCTAKSTAKDNVKGTTKGGAEITARGVAKVSPSWYSGGQAHLWTKKEQKLFCWDLGMIEKEQKGLKLI